MQAEDVTGCQRLAGQVSRYHTWPTLQRQSIAEHSWQVNRIFHQIFGQPTTMEQTYIQYHDAGEIATGDLPFPVKSKNPMIKETFDHMEVTALKHMRAFSAEIDEGAKKRVKICDLLEMWEFGQQEFAMGNRYAQPIIDRTYVVIEKLAMEYDISGRTLGLIMRHMGEFVSCSR